jgi:hypothetical protein
MHREHVVVGDHTVVIEHGNRRASSNEMIKAYLRTGRYAVNVDEETEVQQVYLNNRLVGIIRRSINGTFVSGRYTARNRNLLVEMMLSHFLKND